MGLIQIEMSSLLSAYNCGGLPKKVNDNICSIAQGNNQQ